MADSPIFRFDGDDPAMQAAYQQARANFRYFWRELASERRRIVPALDFACVKAPFTDGDQVEPESDGSNAEQMWLSEIDFDGAYVSGVLINTPNWLKSVQEGDGASFALNEISDWMYVVDGQVFGGYTVNLIRSRMSAQERQEHDEVWGLDFGDPERIRVTPDWQEETGGEHPMSVNMAPALREQIAKDPSILTHADERGWTLLHDQALAGSAPTVRVLLESGANPNVRTSNGQTPLQLAQSLGWENVVALLTRR